jgi:hypothetical protein
MTKNEIAALNAVKNYAKPIDAYQASKLTGASVMESGRALHSLALSGYLIQLNVGGEINPLAEQFQII